MFTRDAFIILPGYRGYKGFKGEFAENLYRLRNDINLHREIFNRKEYGIRLVVLPCIFHFYIIHIALLAPGEISVF